ncbi:MAG: N-acetylneuraminate synthase [Candidatus Gorgyraea atricola]|nr:N-acetylneuraminate synthase [Candidatus Gorgyraea atricola]
MDKVFIIAEAGVNHNGSVDIAKRMVDAAIEADVDAIKFQTFKAEKIITKSAPKAEYQKDTTDKEESHFDMIKKLELDMKAHLEILDYCKKNKIAFLSSPFDSESIDLLDKLGLNLFKIPSGEITNLPYIRKIGSLKKEIILSTGMSDLKEIENALNILEAFGTPKGRITVLHCNTEYPTPIEDVNLQAMVTMKDTFGVNVGYSDHTCGIEVSIAAVAMGASVIEKHFTLDKNMQGPDHKASLEPDELKAMTKAIRNTEKAMGDGVKRASQSELKNKVVVRKSIVASRGIIKDEIFTEKSIIPKRPGSGISPMEWDNIIGKKAKRNFNEGEMIEL